jgi:hypothetical protein
MIFDLGEILAEMGGETIITGRLHLHVVVKRLPEFLAVG